MSRLLFVVALAAGCGHSRAGGPAWPAASTTADDGGESIAPHEGAKMAVVVERANDTPDVKPAVTPTAPAANPEITPAATAPAATPPVQEDILLNEDIIIEIDD